MTAKEFAEKMQIIADAHRGIEEQHMEADDLMDDLLTDLGYGQGMAIYRTLEKWYA